MKKEFFILGAVIACLLAYLVFHSDQKSNYTLPDLPRVAVEDVTTLAIEKNGETIHLDRENGVWTVSDKQYPADTGTVKKLLDVVENLRVSALVSQSQDFTRYDLTPEQAVKVTAKKGNEILRSFELGKTAPTHRHTFVKLAGHKGVYHALGNFRNDFDRDVAGFRAKKVFGFDREALTSLVIERKNVQRRVIVRQPDDRDKQPPTWESDDGKGVDAGKVEALVGDLIALDCASYTDEKMAPKDAGAAPVLRVAVTTGSGDKTETFDLVLHRKMENGDYQGVSSQTVYPFILNAYQGDDLVSWADGVLGIKQEEKNPENQ